MLVAGPNLAIDRTLYLDALRPGEVLRFTRADVTAGGKGVNVCRAARSLGASAALVGFIAGRTGEALAALAADEGIDLEAIPIAGEVRSAAIIIESDGRTTVLNEPGPPIDEGDWGRYQRAVEQRLDRHRMLVCIGSAPPGAPPDAYGRLVRIAHDGSISSLVDAAGLLLAGALDQEPDFVAPNVHEAEAVLGLGTGRALVDSDDTVKERAIEAARRLVERGAGTALVTADRAGLALASRREARWVNAPEVAVANPIGAGDAFAAGFSLAIEEGATMSGAVAQGMAAAAASVEQELAGALDPERSRALKARIDIPGGESRAGPRGLEKHP
ncbi:MAG: 1-phosphofructokinase family hexose kinase [Actinomycetota bacterium]